MHVRTHTHTHTHAPQVVCQGTQAQEIRIRVASFECLHEIASMYYGKLVPYMTEIYNITVKAVKEDQEDVALQVSCSHACRHMHSYALCCA